LNSTLKPNKGAGLCQPAPSSPNLLFHENWWLEAATHNNFHRVTVTDGDLVIGSLPFVIRKRIGFTELRMPPFTHLLGPMIDAGTGKAETRLRRRWSIIRRLVDQLPPHDYFRQSLNYPWTDDGCGFQDCGFNVAAHYTFEIDCRADLESIWNAMNFKVRQHVRRANEKLSITSVTDPLEFELFYKANLIKSGRSNFVQFETFNTLFLECQRRNAGQILSARWPDGRPAAMIFLVWGHGTMYYLMSTRAADLGDNGSINLLIWSAIKEAHQRKLVLDLDGIISSGTARFLSGFGGQIKARMIVERARFLYGAVQLTRKHFIRHRVSNSFV
jgi:hypothetical protein